ncbi:MAG: hypothetical protein HQL69_17490 [Magnetococcales bacterium]|nr:hypothetical protein [Magnetococcales bacterium]
MQYEIPNSILASLMESGNADELCVRLKKNGCLDNTANCGKVVALIQSVFDRCSDSEAAMPIDMSLSDIVAKTLYMDGLLSKFGQRLYITSAVEEGPNKNQFAGIADKTLETTRFVSTQEIREKINYW